MNELQHSSLSEQGRRETPCTSSLPQWLVSIGREPDEKKRVSALDAVLAKNTVLVSGHRHRLWQNHWPAICAQAEVAFGGCTEEDERRAASLRHDTRRDLLHLPAADRQQFQSHPSPAVLKDIAWISDPVCRFARSLLHQVFPMTCGLEGRLTAAQTIDAAEINVSLLSPTPRDPRLRIYVKMLPPLPPQGKTITLIAEAFDTVYNIKEKIHEKQGIPTWQQSLSFSDNRLGHGRLSADNLDDRCTLAERGIENESTLHLALRSAPPDTHQFLRTLSPASNSESVGTGSTVSLRLQYPPFSDVQHRQRIAKVIEIVQQVVRMRVVLVRRTVRARLFWPVPRVLRWDAREIWTFLLATREKLARFPPHLRSLIMEFFALPRVEWEDAEPGSEVEAVKRATIAESRHEILFSAFPGGKEHGGSWKPKRT